MGANSRTYKFALGEALLEFAEQGRDAVSLRELAIPYALRLAERAERYPQGPLASVGGASDFLAQLKASGPESLEAGAPTDRLTRAAVESMPGMVMQKFHNLRGVGAVAHRFYDLTGKGAARQVVLRPELKTVAVHAAALRAELHARWSVVETCFDATLGRELISAGVVLSADGQQLLAPIRRVAVAGARAALIGFQHGRCFYCRIPVGDTLRSVHVDHVYPFSLMKTGAWAGPDLNGVWNLVVACAGCNLTKSARLPTPAEVTRLLHRNDAIAASPHPLRRALELSMSDTAGAPATTSDARAAFVRQVDTVATDRGLQ
ncbi:MAG: hypothetical protein JWP11_3221 [Frankiales bacterium]|nr:hypothetical protein [Frankiales bacterium]